MPKDVFSIRLEKADIQFIEEYAKRFGMTKTAFLQLRVEEMLVEMRADGLPEQTSPSPEDTDFWKRYTRGIKDAEKRG